MKVVFTSPVEHDGKAFAAGDSADLPKEVAALLIEAGAAEAPGKKAAAAEEPLPRP